VIRVELVKLIRRPRVWVAIALLCLLPIIVAIFIAQTRIVPPPGQGGAFLSAVLSNGLLYPAAAMAIVVPLFLPVAVAVLDGDAVAGEAATGTLRYLLIRAVGASRNRSGVLVVMADSVGSTFSCQRLERVSRSSDAAACGAQENRANHAKACSPVRTGNEGNVFSAYSVCSQAIGSAPASASAGRAWRSKKSRNSSSNGRSR
jgi:hypothetical protein